MASSAPPPFLTNIQYLRAIAALMVVAFHAGITSGIPFNGGAFGVHLFFVISGFIMVAITDTTTRPGPFFLARLWRIAPPYWAATIAALLVYAFTVGGRPPAAEIVASFLFLPWGAPGNGARYFPVLDVGWTLNYEMFFYAAFALTLLLRRRWQQLVILTAAFLALCALRPPVLPFTFWGQSIVLEFIAGAWIGAYWKTGRPLVPMALLVLAVGIAAVWLSAPPALLTLLTAAVLVASAVAVERGWKWAPLLFMGEASYSIYLWHVFAVRLVPLDGAAGFALAMAAGTAAGIAGYFAIERPLRRRSAAWRERRRAEGQPAA